MPHRALAPKVRSELSREEINRRILQVVREKGMSQADCVRATGATSPTVSDWFNKGAVPDASTLGMLARAAHVNCHWLITGQGPRQAPGEGDTATDRAFALGARAAITEMKRLQSTLEEVFFGERATSLDEAALAAMQVIERTGDRPPRKPRQVRSR